MLLSGRLRGTLWWCVRAIFTLVVVILTILLVAAFDARRAPDLKPWHTASLESEATAEMLETADFDEYLEIEARVFAEYAGEVEGDVPGAGGRRGPVDREGVRARSDRGIFMAHVGFASAVGLGVGATCAPCACADGGGVCFPRDHGDEVCHARTN